MKGAEIYIKIFLLIAFVYSVGNKGYVYTRNGSFNLQRESHKTSSPVESSNHKKNENIAPGIFVSYTGLCCRHLLYYSGLLCAFIVAICILPIKYGIDKFRGKPLIK